jgi:hypothetical protein
MLESESAAGENKIRTETTCRRRSAAKMISSTPAGLSVDLVGDIPAPRPEEPAPDPVRLLLPEHQRRALPRPALRQRRLGVRRPPCPTHRPRSLLPTRRRTDQPRRLLQQPTSVPALEGAFLHGRVRARAAQPRRRAVGRVAGVRLGA